ncbi:MAG: DUF5694 domain-containing protein [Xanthomonadales bacterium]|nr:DUF5694 domain-containing protein [Xanthomonadales bacterium]
MKSFSSKISRWSYLFLVVVAISVFAGELPKGKVMLIGVFHFKNPGLDVVKSDVIDVMTPENQAYLEALSDRIAEFKPTAVLLEYDRKNDAIVNERYQQYLAGDYELGVNEIYQLGFRIAKKAGLDRVHGFDEGEVHWNAEPLFEQLEKNYPERKAELDGLIESLGEERAQMHRTLSLAEVLRKQNEAEADRKNKGLYLMTNDIGAGEGFEGADASASWWHRNFRMYSHIQKHAGPGERVVAIAGQGHTAILKDLLADDPDRVGADVYELF